MMLVSRREVFACGWVVLGGFTAAAPVPVPPSIKDRPVEKLIAELDGTTTEIQLAATTELFRRGNDVLPALKKAGAKNLAMGSTVQAASRLDMVYTLIGGLTPRKNGQVAFAPGSFGLRVTEGTKVEDVTALGKKHGFKFDAAKFHADHQPNVYVYVGDPKKMSEIMQTLLATEPAVWGLNLNYIEVN